MWTYKYRQGGDNLYRTIQYYFENLDNAKQSAIHTFRLYGELIEEQEIDNRIILLTPQKTPVHVMLFELQKAPHSRFLTV